MRLSSSAGREAEGRQRFASLRKMAATVASTCAVLAMTSSPLGCSRQEVMEDEDIYLVVSTMLILEHQALVFGRMPHHPNLTPSNEPDANSMLRAVGAEVDEALSLPDGKARVVYRARLGRPLSSAEDAAVNELRGRSEESQQRWTVPDVLRALDGSITTADTEVPDPRPPAEPEDQLPFAASVGIPGLISIVASLVFVVLLLMTARSLSSLRKAMPPSSTGIRYGLMVLCNRCCIYATACIALAALLAARKIHIQAIWPIAAVGAGILFLIHQVTRISRLVRQIDTPYWRTHGFGGSQAIGESVFISYRRIEADLARGVAEAFASCGSTLWLDQYAIPLFDQASFQLRYE